MATTNNNTTSSIIKVSDKNNNEILPELKNQEKWLCWSYKKRDGKTTKIPKSIDGGFAKINDADTWTTYEKARQYTLENDDIDGIGFVFDDQSTHVGIDLDDVRDPQTGELIVEWAEDVVETVDSYTEVSPSGEGLHIIAHAIMVDDANNKEKFDDGTELEMYDSGRFFTMTFDHVENTPKSPQMCQKSVSEVYDEYMADDTADNTSNETKTVDIELNMDDQELIDKAKNADDGDKFAKLWGGDTSMHNGDHSRADMALLTKLAFWTQGDKNQIERLFTKSGLSRPKWTDRQDYRDRSIDKAISNCSEFYEPQTEEDEEEIEWDNEYLIKYSDVYINGGYSKKVSKKDGSRVPVQVTNYTINLKSVLIERDGTKKWDIEVEPISNVEESYDIVVEPSIFNDIRKYKQEVQIGETTVWNGDKSDLNDIRQIIAHQDAPVKQSTHKIGLHKTDDGNTELVTPDKTISDGDNEYRYVSTGNAIETNWDLDDIDDYDTKEVKEIIKLISKTRDTDRGIPILGYMYATLFTNEIREFEDELPMLNVDGEPDSGKTSTLEYYTQAFGLDGDNMSAQDTRFGMIKNLSSTTTIPIWLDEYKPSDMSDYKLKNFKELIRKTTKAANETRGNADKTQDVYNLSSPVIITGEQGVKGNAEQRRLIRTQLKKSTTDSDTQTAKAWAKLSGGSYKAENGNIEYCSGYDPQNHAKAIYEFALDTDLDIDIWNDCKTYVHNLLSDNGIKGIDGLELNSLVMVKLGTAVYKMFAHKMDVDTDELISDDDIDESLLYVADQMGAENRVSHLDEFFALLSDAARQHHVNQNQEYTIINQDRDGEELHIKLRACHQAVTQYVNNNGLTGYELLNNATDYRKRLRDIDVSYLNDLSKVDRDINRCIAVDTKILENKVDDFEIDNFYRN